jgi:cysteine-rich repeat protein
MSRRYLIIASIAAHGVVAAGLFISGIWKLERLDYKHRASLTLGAMIPLGETGGGEGELQEEKKEKKREKKEKKREKTKVDLAQVEKIEKTDDKEPVEVASTGGGGGVGTGEGPDVGPPTGGGGGGGTCDPLLDPDRCQPPVVEARCGDGIVQAAEQCDDGNTTSGDKCSATCKIEQILLPPGIFTGMRIAGETRIVPPDTVKTQMLRDGKERTLGSFKLCIDASGTVSSISPINSGTKYPAYDSKITTAMRAWRYKPYTVKNQGAVTAVPACSVVTFVYTIK